MSKATVRGWNELGEHVAAWNRALMALFLRKSDMPPFSGDVGPLGLCYGSVQPTAQGCSAAMSGLLGAPDMAEFLPQRTQLQGAGGAPSSLTSELKCYLNPNQATKLSRCLLLNCPG